MVAFNTQRLRLKSCDIVQNRTGSKSTFGRKIASVLLFTGKEHEEETELDYFGARYYDADLALWISPDLKRQFNNPYLYAGNGMNPINGIDPDGNSLQEALTIAEELGCSNCGSVNGPINAGGTLKSNFYFAVDLGTLVAGGPGTIAKGSYLIHMSMATSALSNGYRVLGGAMFMAGANSMTRASFNLARSGSINTGMLQFLAEGSLPEPFVDAAATVDLFLAGIDMVGSLKASDGSKFDLRSEYGVQGAGSAIQTRTTVNELTD